MARMNRVSLARKKELEEPDKILAFLLKVTDTVVKHRNRIIAGLVGLVVIVALVFGMQTYLRNKEVRAFNRLAAVSPIEAPGEADSRPATQEEKSPYRSLYEKYGGTMAGKMAGFRYADACYQSGDFSSAIAIYKKLSKNFSGSPFFRQLALSSLGYAYEAAGEKAQARACFEKIVADPEAVLKDTALFNLARLWEETGAQEKSRELFATLAADYPDSLYADLAKEKSSG